MPAVKNVGEPCAGEPHARIEVAAGGNQASRASTRRAAQAPPADPTALPSGAMYKREEDGIVLVDQAKCRGWRFCVSGCPYKKGSLVMSVGEVRAVGAGGGVRS
jgi:Fe-S-cluster-containing hydrogenase component 2